MKKGSIMIIMGLLLIAAALCITGYNLWDCSRAARATESVLEKLVPQIDTPTVTEYDINIISADADNVEYPDYVLDPDMSMPVEIVDGRGYVGVLKIPALELELSVLEEWGYTNLTISPCLYSGTAYKGNMVICAHNYPRHFGRIRDLNIGDEISFTDMSGNVFTYTVIEVETLMPTAVEEMISDSYDMTLFTCTVGGRSRIAVRCEKCTGSN